MTISVLPDKDAVAAAAAELLREARGNVVLAGGSTPRAAYERAAGAVDATFWLGDERFVALDDERSNARMVRETLGVEIEVVRTELGLEAAADDYDARLAGVTLDLVLLGSALTPTPLRCFRASPGPRDAASAQCPKRAWNPSYRGSR